MTLRDDLNKSLHDCDVESNLFVKIDDVLPAIPHLKAD